MQAKLFAWTNCSVAEFMLKLPFPPQFPVVRASISQLKVKKNNHFRIQKFSIENFYRFRISNY